MARQRIVPVPVPSRGPGTSATDQPGPATATFVDLPMPIIRQVAPTVSMAPANRAPLPDCVPKLPLRHRTAGRMARSATFLVGSTPGTSR